MQREIHPGESATEAIVRAVADRTDTEPTALQPLGDFADPDAIDSFFDGYSGDGDRSLTLVYEGCRVTVDGEAVTVEDAPRSPE